MPSHDDSTPNAFHSNFLQELAGHEDPPTAGEAAHGGLWRVVHRGRVRYRDAELLDALNLAVGLVRSPVALAAVILAAGAAALEPAGKILAHKVLVSEP